MCFELLVLYIWNGMAWWQECKCSNLVDAKLFSEINVPVGTLTNGDESLGYSTFPLQTGLVRLSNIIHSSGSPLHFVDD